MSLIASSKVGLLKLSKSSMYLNVLLKLLVSCLSFLRYLALTVFNEMHAHSPPDRLTGIIITLQFLFLGHNTGIWY